MQRYKCKNCKFRFVWTSDLPRRNYFSEIISFAVEIYTSLRICASLQGVTIILKKAFGVIVSRQTIWRWVRDAKKPFTAKKQTESTVWHADETGVKIKGKLFWLWIVRCKKTGQVLAWHLSKKRTYSDAKKLMQKALAVAGAQPKQVVTDGLHQYSKAIYKVIGWNYKEHQTRHIRASGIGRNWFIERLNREVKRRTNWFCTFQSVEGAKAFFNMWFHHWNQNTT